MGLSVPGLAPPSPAAGPERPLAAGHPPGTRWPADAPDLACSPGRKTEAPAVQTYRRLPGSGTPGWWPRAGLGASLTWVLSPAGGMVQAIVGA